MEIGNKIKEVDEKIIKMKQEREILSSFNAMTNLQEFVNRSHRHLSSDIPLCEKIECINEFRKNINSHLTELSIKYEGERRYQNTSYHPIKNYNIRNPDNFRYDRSLSKNQNITTPSLWVSGFNETTEKQDLFSLFSPLDPKLTLDLVVHRGNYAFINFRDGDAAVNAHNRCWNLNGEILETNVRYPNRSVN